MSSPQAPDYITHYHLAQKRPFLNLSDLSPDELSIVMRDLEDRRAKEELRRVFGRRYMELRRLTEERLYDLFVRAGGKPERTVPHYFVLGSCEWFRGLSPHMQEIVIPLRHLVQETTSFTYPDSFTAMEFGPRFDLPQVPRPYHGKVFLLQELDEVVARYGLPSDDDTSYGGYQNRPFEKYIEVQVWSDQPVGAFLAPRSEITSRSDRSGTE